MEADAPDPSSDRDPWTCLPEPVTRPCSTEESISQAAAVWREGEALAPGYAGISRNG